MKDEGISALGYALLGLLYQKPSSGYDLRKVFSTTPLGNFSDSPGAIYPALRRLEERALISGEIEAASGMRRRKAFHLTAKGRLQLKAWLNKPVSREQVTRGLGEAMLKFAFMETVSGDRRTLSFLRSLEKELREHCAVLRRFFEVHKSKMPASGMLALKSGLLGYETQLKWAIEARAFYEGRQK